MLEKEAAKIEKEDKRRKKNNFFFFKSFLMKII